ncbi:bZIP transcription factor [Aspergillus affinis]|uniref:bZIP transcription factor n=1 Tax=Aspergillus affinis TaxID=1070780 RepID=UPI0022FDEDF5|nr:uncharacterized protein KD926_011246 [Aspergillus affinis]KAI9038112.1 hypothetical protein KD926_011246 [Aspergillus affinis]
MTAELNLYGPGPDFLSTADPTATDSSPIFFNNPLVPDWLELPASLGHTEPSYESLLASTPSWPSKPTLNEPTPAQPQAPQRSGRRSTPSKPKKNASKEEKEKREKFLERNRMAASKCRQKKRQNTNRLQGQFQVAAESKARLEAEVAQLHGEVLYLKDELLRHSQCDDLSIKTYLQQMVSQVTHQEEPILRTPELSDPPGPLSSSPDSSISAHQQEQQAGFDFDDSLQLSDSAMQELDTARRDSEQSLLSTTCTLFSDASIDDMIDLV